MAEIRKTLMVYNFNDLLFIFGASEKSTRVRGGFVSEEYSLTITKGNYAGSFAIYSKDNPSSPVFLELIRNIKALEHYDTFVKITFRNNSSIRVFRSSETTIDYSDYVNDYAQYNDGIGVLESVIKKDVRVPGTNIMLEKGDRITVKSRIREAYNEDRLAKALGCRSLNFEKLPMNEDLGLLVYDGEKQGVFYLADNSTGSIEFTGLYRDILEAFYDRSGKAGVIRFKDGSSIVIRDLGGFLDIEKKNFESAPKKNVKETTENVLFRATTRGGKDFFEIKKTTFDDGGTYYDWSSERSGGGGNADKLPLAEFIGEILTPDVTYDKIVVDNLGIGNLLKNTYKNINSMFDDLKKAPKGSEDHQLWFTVWRVLKKHLMMSNKDTVSAISNLIDRVLTDMKKKIDYLKNIL